MRIVPALQPIINVTNQSVMGYEILARWWDGIRIYGPEEVNLPWSEIDQLVLGQLLSYVGAMHDCPYRMFLNVSAETMMSDRQWNLWITKMNQLIWAVSYPLTVEVVETISDETLRSRWSDLMQLGIQIALDDFGVKNSTMDRLQAHPWDFCKFEAADLGSLLSLTAVEYCKKNNIHLIAEKIETVEESMVACKQGMNDQQGFHHGEPVLITERIVFGVVE